MTSSDFPNTDVSSLEADIAALKRDISDLIDHLKNGATRGAHTAAEQISAGSARLYDRAAAEGELAVKAVSSRVIEQPLMCVLVALGMGFIGGRLLPR